MLLSVLSKKAGSLKNGVRVLFYLMYSDPITFIFASYFQKVKAPKAASPLKDQCAGVLQLVGHYLRC